MKPTNTAKKRYSAYLADGIPLDTFFISLTLYVNKITLRQQLLFMTQII